MGIDRRKFLKIAGLSAIAGLGGKTAFDLFAPGEVEASLKKLPLTQAKRWGMAIDTTKVNEEIIDKCQEVCNNIHNIPDWGDPKSEIKWIWAEIYEHAFPGIGHDYQAEELTERAVPLLCNHCDNPPCCRVCPTKATWKRKSDGVVIVDPHRCIGCRFCMAGCPYGARSFNWGDPRKAPSELNSNYPTNPAYPTRTKGVVEKCNFCAERIAIGQYPACVEAANEIEKDSMFFGDLEDHASEVRKVLRDRYAIRRKTELGTGPNIYYLV
jgi:molybdopterin-containing oxidoreductase family iron-sulfur binding subunit